MIKNQLKSCCNSGGDFSFYRCEFEHPCSLGHKPKSCAYDFQKTVPDIDLLRDDCYEQGYTVFGVEAHTVFLSGNIDFDVVGDNHAVSSWKKFVKNNKLKPFLIEERSFNQFQLRSSELGGTCPIEGIISKVSDAYKANFPENTLALVGTAAHALGNTQHDNEYIHNETWNLIDVDPVHRDCYCEKELWYDHKGIMLRGHVDVLLTMGDYLVIFDFKRALGGGYQSRKYKLQLLSYGKAIEQQLNKTFPGLFLITSVRPYPPDKRGRKRFPRYQITLAGDELLKDLDEEILNRFEFQHRAIHDQGDFLDNLKERRETCSGKHCFGREICNDLVGKLEEGHDLEEFLMEEVKF